MYLCVCALFVLFCVHSSERDHQRLVLTGNLIIISVDNWAVLLSFESFIHLHS